MDGDTAPSNLDILQAINAIQKRVDLACKHQSSDLPVFKSEGNKQQFEHTAKVANLIESALSSLEEVDPSSAVQHLKQALTELHQRQKLIKIADRSPLGWLTVKEYVADELADDSGDEKRLRKAEKAAATKKSESTKKAARAQARPRPYPRSRALPYSSAPCGYASFRRYTPRPFTPAFRAENRICFQCGITGHVRTNCPSLRASRQAFRQLPGAGSLVGPPGTSS
ncbi:uncharacterized protein [Diadema antillarum]|uniref:uncharacterized protein n=1 Tax=Diadema antillarum TaxID=105358 RepID=UPI003A8B68D4